MSNKNRNTGDSPTNGRIRFTNQPPHLGSTSCGRREPPEKQLTLFALWLAVLEKAASCLRKLDFVWATVVLLGGFASNLELIDFWCVTIILVGEGTRVFGRSNELKWQHNATQTSTAGHALRSSSRFFCRVARAIVNPASAVTSATKHVRAVVAPAWSATSTIEANGARNNAEAAQFQDKVVADMKQHGWVYVSKNISRLLNFLQVLSALTCVVLSVMRLWKHDYGDGRNKRPALALFYTLALVESLLFLLEEAYWIWKSFFCRLLEEVSRECELGVYGLVSLKRFFYDAYSQCITGSIFDGVKMDLITWAEEQIQSDFLDEQLIGVRILQQYAKNKVSAQETLRKVGRSTHSIERLIEMINWKRPNEVEVRRCAAEILNKLAGRRQNALRLASIPGAMESVMSLLGTEASHADGPPDANEEDTSPIVPNYDHLQFNLLGLLILKKLARDHDNCGKIGKAHGLLSKVIKFMDAKPSLLSNVSAADSQIRAVKRALQVVQMLVSTTGKTGKALRDDVAENVFTVTNLRGILQHGEKHGKLQKLAIDILTGLAMDDKAKEGIVGTGGMVDLLLSIFFNAERLYAKELCSDAGEALSMLALESERSCAVILKEENVIERLVSALDDNERWLSAARLLRNLCAYSRKEASERLRPVTAAMPVVLKATMTKTEDEEEVIEVSIGLTTQICKFIDCDQFTNELRNVGFRSRAYVEKLVSFLKKYEYPAIKVPRMRRFTVQQAIWLMKSNRDYVTLFKKLEMEWLLVSIAARTSELECFHVFSGSMGLSRHHKSFSTIVELALELLHGGGGGGAPAEE